ncbi:hypothetical protein BJX65DRAFT_290341 [Aspergillus insuetus]
MPGALIWISLLDISPAWVILGVKHRPRIHMQQSRLWVLQPEESRLQVISLLTLTSGVASTTK